MRNRSFGSPLLAILIVAVSLVTGYTGGVTAQGATIDCTEFVLPPAATIDNSTPEATPEPVGVVPFPAEGGDLTVFAAASLTDSFEAIQEDIETANPNVSITYNFAGSQALVTQLTEGAEADVFASANNSQMAAAQEASVIGGDPFTFAQNQLAIVVPADNPAGLETYADLGKDGIRLVLAQADVPVGQYSRQSICGATADTATYGDGFVENVQANIVSEENNVRSVLTKVSLGEADAGIVYTTDITADVADSVAVIEVPVEINVIASYPIAPVADGDTALAEAFISYLLNPAGQATLAEYGFDPKP